MKPSVLMDNYLNFKKIIMVLLKKLSLMLKTRFKNNIKLERNLTSYLPYKTLQNIIIKFL